MPALAIRNKNPGNIRPLPKGDMWQGQVGTNGGFCVFSTMAYGIRALCKNLIAYQKYQDGHGGIIDTVREAISRWAPPADHNDTEAYIALVCSVLDCRDDDEFDFHDPAFLYWMVIAIGEQESGHKDFNAGVTDADIDEGIRMALL